jgi:hypothetical protein
LYNSSIAYLGGFTIIAFATIWFLSQSPYTIECKSKDKSDKPRKSDKSDKSDKLKFNKKGGDTSKSDKRSSNTNKSSAGLWASIREKIANKLGFGKKSKSQKSATTVKSSRSNGLKLNGKKRAPKDCGACGSASSSKTSAKSNGSTGSSNIINSFRDVKSQETRIESFCDSSSSNSNNFCQKDSITRVKSCGDSGSSNGGNRLQKDRVIQKIRVESYGDSSSSSSNNLCKKDQITQEVRAESGSSFSSNSNKINKIKQQQLRNLKLTRSSNCHKLSSRDMENKYRLGDCSTSKLPEKVNLTSPIRNVKCLSKSLCQDIDNKESNLQDSLTDIEKRIAETINKINLIDLQGIYLYGNK